MTLPASPKLYHITHVANLASIAAADGLRSDARMAAAGGPGVSIGMPHLKSRRLAMPVACHPGDVVGDYVPFYFCPRSVMLYLLHRGNHPELTYRDGQQEIVHLEFDLYAVAEHSTRSGGRFAFTRSNASARYTEFLSDLADLGSLGWAAIRNPDFRDASVKEAKQAEFLAHGTVPWSLVERIGAQSHPVAERAADALRGIEHQPLIEVRRDWYF
jgi:hypothetical protein